jgi:hypothetical protein
MKQTILLLALLIICFSQCKKKAATEPAIKKNILLAGEQFKTSVGTNAVQWYNGVETILSKNTTSAAATDCIIVGNDQYVVGYYDSLVSQFGYGKTVYWKNGVEYPINSINITSHPVAIRNIGSDIYILCEERSAAQLSAGTYIYAWVLYKNGQVYDSGSGKDLSVYDMEVNGNDIYFLGQATVSGMKQAFYYKNGVLKYISNFALGNLNTNDMCIINGDVNIVGNYSASGGTQQIFYYTNGIIKYLVNDANVYYANYILAKNSKPMIIGSDGNFQGSWYDGVSKRNAYIFSAVKIANDGKLYGVTDRDETLYADEVLQYKIGTENNNLGYKVKAIDVK